MKLTGLLGTGSGKLGNSVFATIAGEQIVRQYQPVVANPSTTSQVVQRSKFKMLSQLGALMADDIAIPRVGLVSSRNRFIKINSEKVEAGDYTNGISASVYMGDIQLTASNKTFIGTLSIDEADASAIKVKLEGSTADAINPAYDRIELVVYTTTQNGDIKRVYATSVENASSFNKITGATLASGQRVYAYAYGVSFANAAAKARYEALAVGENAAFATLVAKRIITESDATLSKTAVAYAGAA